MSKIKTAIFAAAVAATAGITCAGGASAYEYQSISEGSIDSALLNALYDASYTMTTTGKLVPHKDTYMEHDALMGEFYFVDGIEFDCSEGDPLADVESWDRFSYYFSNISYLKLCSTENIDFDELAKLTKLDTLQIISANEDAITPDYYIDGGEFRTLEGIENMPALTSLYVSNTPVSSLAGIRDSETLEKLSLIGTGLTDIEGLDEIPRLWYPQLQNNIITDISPIVTFCIQNGICEADTAYESFFDNDAYSDVISGNTIYARAVKGKLYDFRGFDYISEILFDKSPKIETEGVTLDKEAGTVILNEDRGTIKIYDWDNGTTIYLTVMIDAEDEGEKNPDTVDNSLKQIIAGVAIASFAGLGVLTAIKSRR